MEKQEEERKGKENKETRGKGRRQEEKGVIKGDESGKKE